MFRRSHPLWTFTWLAGAVVGVACSIPDYDARQKPEGEGGEDPGSGGVSGQSTNGGVTSAGNGPIGGSAGSSTPGGTAGDSGGSSGGSGKSAAGDGGESGSNGGNAGSGTAGNTGSGGAGNTGGAGSGGGAGKGGAGSGGTTGGAGSGGAGKGGAGNGGAGSGGAGKGGAGNGGAGSGGAGKGGAGNGGAGSGGAGKGGGGSGGSGPLCFTQNSSNLLVNAGFNNSNVSQYVAQDAFIALSHSTLDATGCASSGSLVVTNSHPDGLNSGALYCLTAISPGTTYNVGGWMMEPSGFAQGQVFLHFIFTDGPSCTGSFVGDVTSLEGPSLSSPFDTWRSVRADGLVAPPGAVSLGVHTRVIKNFPNALSYRAHFDMLYATPVPGAF